MLQQDDLHASDFIRSLNQSRTFVVFMRVSKGGWIPSSFTWLDLAGPDTSEMEKTTKLYLPKLEF